MRFAISGAVFVVFLALPYAASAQSGSFGVGGRFSFVRNEVPADAPATRFMGGQIRARTSPRTGMEVALDLRTETNLALTERVRDYPIQASLLLFPLRTPFAPYVLGGGGWYTHRVDTLQRGDVVGTTVDRRFGWHAGFGAELRMGRHTAVHADYRYTFLRLASDQTGAERTTPPRGSGIRTLHLLPSYERAMWTTGVTLYF